MVLIFLFSLISASILGEGMDLGCASNVTVGLIGTQAVQKYQQIETDSRKLLPVFFESQRLDMRVLNGENDNKENPLR